VLAILESSLRIPARARREIRSFLVMVPDAFSSNERKMSDWGGQVVFTHICGIKVLALSKYYYTKSLKGIGFLIVRDFCRLTRYASLFV